MHNYWRMSSAQSSRKHSRIPSNPQSRSSRSGYSYYYGYDRDNGMEKFKGGDPRIVYDEFGRILSQPSTSIPRAMPVSGEGGYANPQETLSGLRRFFTRGRSTDPAKAFDRRYEWRSSGRSVDAVNADAGSADIIVEKRKTDGYMVEDRLVYNEKPRFWWLFVVLAILLLILGVVNILFCLDFHAYSRFYTGLAILILGILGLIHNGNLREGGWKIFSIIYIIWGIITAALVFLCLGFILFTFVHETIDITQYGREEFIDITTTRIFINRESVRINISSWETHIWVCYALDGISVACCLAGFFVLTSVVIVVDNYYNNNYIYIRQVEPFCEPMLWNPYGQIPLGQTMIFFGFVISEAVFGSNSTNYQDYLFLVWAGIPAIVCGFVCGIAYKRTHRKAIAWAIVGIILQIINIIISVIAIIFMTYGMYENIVTIDNNYTMTTTDYTIQLMSASVIMFVIGDCVALANIFWAIAALVCLFKRSCCGDSKSRTYLEEDVEYLEDPFPQKLTKSREIITVPYEGDPRALPVDRILNRY